MSTGPLVSVVILSYNRKADLCDGLERILAQRPPFEVEVIVVDNASSDGSGEKVAADFPQVRWIALPENIGVAGYNRGFAACRGEFVLILDDDSCPAPGSIAGMVGAFRRKPEVGVVAFDVRSFHSYRENQEKAPPVEESPATYQMGFNGAGVAIRRRVLEEVGGYAEEFFLYWNEQDLAIRILEAGYRILHSPALVSFHKYSPTHRQNRRGPFYYTRNLYWVIWKHLPLPRMACDTLRLLFLTLFHTLEQRTTVYLEATWSAFFDGSRAWRKRRPISRKLAKRLRISPQLAFILFR